MHEFLSSPPIVILTVFFRVPISLFFICILQITIYSDRVIGKSEVRKGREAGTIHRWFIGVVLLV